MHISEGMLSAPVLAAGAVLAVAGTAAGLRRLDAEQVPRVGVTAAALFVASLVHVPVPLTPVSAHLILNGLAGLLLGRAVFPAFLVALFLQAVLFQFGGLTTLGVNTCVMALPGLIAYMVFGKPIRTNARLSAAAAFGAGAGAVLLSGILAASALFFSGRAFAEAAGVVLGAHVPVMIIEGVICVMIAAFLRKVKPAMLARPGGAEVSDGA